MDNFHPIVRDWFLDRFPAPTQAQAEGWEAIAQGRHTLIAAPTGSGKTLAAFLNCVDQLVRTGVEEGLPETTQVVYVSPLKALSNDIHKNLSVPLQEISELAETRGMTLPEIRAEVRTGDTPASQRQKMAKNPPHILITTPESLYILLTSKSGRRGLKGVKTLILDEIHAVADDKRGSHLALSVERLCSLADGPVTRIGLSATQKPIEDVARLLVGASNMSDAGDPECTIVDTGHSRQMDIDLALPKEMELGPIATHELWADTLDDIAGLVREHGTTLVFVNTRRLVERVAHQLSLRLGEDAVAAHHGSLSRATRLDAEEKLRSGRIKVCVATASLELGIDVGVVDLVCQVGSPRSIGLLLQRVGRSGHTVGGTPKGRLFPLTRDELIECAALMKAISDRNLDALSIPHWPLDVLAQQMVAACAVEEWEEDGLYEMFTRAYPYKDLPRDRYDSLVEALSRGYADRLGRRGAYLHRDGVNDKLKGRRGAGLAAMTSGGAIPDNADYDVVLDPEGAFVGTVNEDFAIESMAGDVFLLGNTPWKIKRVEQGRVRVEDAQGQAPTIPFWLGEAPGRTWELSDEVSAIRDGIDQRLDNPGEARTWLMEAASVSEEAAAQMVAYIEEGKRVLGMVPTGNRIVAERFFDESGGMQLVIHSPLGSRINRAWGMALRKNICRAFDFELQASATDDGLNFSLDPQLSFPVSDTFSMLKSGNARDVLEQAMLQAPLFGTRWRWNVTRALAILRHNGGSKVPAPLQRMRSDDLLAAVFPAQVACQDNNQMGRVELPDHPLVFETMRDCLTDASDVVGLERLLKSIESGEIQVYARDTVQPSAFSHQILNAMPYAFLDDAPLEERRARAVTLRRALPEDSRDLGRLDPEAIATESANAWPRIRDADELHDALLTLVCLPQEEGARRTGLSIDALYAYFSELRDASRAYLVETDDGLSAFVAAESLAAVRAAYPSARIHHAPPSASSGTEVTEDEATLAMVRGWAESSGPFTVAELAELLKIGEGRVKTAVARLEAEGMIIRGRYREGLEQEELCDRRILARIHASTISRLRKEIEPVPAADFIKFLLRWQHVEVGKQLTGEGGLLDVIDQLQGFEAAAGAWENEILAARVSDLQPTQLDSLSLGGEIVWGRLSRKREGEPPPSGRTSFNRNTPITFALRECLDWLAAGAEEDELPDGGPKEVLEVLNKRGASFVSDIVAYVHRLPSDVEETLWTLAAAGKVTSDSVEILRQRVKGQNGKGRRAGLFRRTQRRRSFGRWSALEPVEPVSEATDAVANQLLRRYGVLCAELIGREPLVPRWRDLVKTLRRMEARGEIRGGRFVAGTTGEQFALPEAVEALREARKSDGGWAVVSACDPLNLVGILTPGDRVPANLGNRIVFNNGMPIISSENGHVVVRTNSDPLTMARARAMLQSAHRDRSISATA